MCVRLNVLLPVVDTGCVKRQRAWTTKKVVRDAMRLTFQGEQLTPAKYHDCITGS